MSADQSAAHPRGMASKLASIVQPARRRMGVLLRPARLVGKDATKHVRRLLEIAPPLVAPQSALGDGGISRRPLLQGRSQASFIH